MVDSPEAYVETALRVANDDVFRRGLSGRLRTNSGRLFRRRDAIAAHESFFESVCAGAISAPPTA